MKIIVIILIILIIIVELFPPKCEKCKKPLDKYPLGLGNEYLSFCSNKDCEENRSKEP